MPTENPADKAAEAVANQADAEAAAASAVADKKTGEAVVAVAAAAEGTVALAKTQAAETMQAAAQKISTFEEQQIWLETQMGSLSAEVASQPQRTHELITAEITPLKETLSKTLEMMQAMAQAAPSIPPTSQPNAAGGADPKAAPPKRRASDKEKPPAKTKRTIRHV